MPRVKINQLAAFLKMVFTNVNKRNQYQLCNFRKQPGVNWF
jgi:hypothetical protein